MSVVAAPPLDPDAERLAELGYRQELARGLRFFDNAAMGFAAISPVVGLYAVVLVGTVVAGPAWVWVLPVALAGQCLLLAVYAELASEFPIAGGAYQWSRRLMGGAYGWLSGWVAICAYAVANTTIAYLGAPWALTLAGITPTPNAIRASARRQARLFRCSARTTRTRTGRAARPARRRPGSRPSRSHSRQLFGLGAEDELDHRADRFLDTRVLDHRNVLFPSLLDDELLEPSDVAEPLQILRHGPQALRGCVADPEMGGVSVLVLDRKHAVDDDGVVSRAGEHPRHEVHSLDNHRPPFLQGSLDRSLDRDQDVGRLVEEAVDERLAGAGVEARAVDRRHVLRDEECAERLPHDVGGRDAVDPQPVRHLGGDRRLAGAGWAADQQDHRLGHAVTRCGRRERTASSRPSPATSFAASTSSAPRLAASSATTSIAAALSSTR